MATWSGLTTILGPSSYFPARVLWRLTVGSFVGGLLLYVKLLLRPRQSRGASLGRLGPTVS